MKKYLSLLTLSLLASVSSTKAGEFEWDKSNETSIKAKVSRLNDKKKAGKESLSEKKIAILHKLFEEKRNGNDLFKIAQLKQQYDELRAQKPIGLKLTSGKSDNFIDFRNPSSNIKLEGLPIQGATGRWSEGENVKITFPKPLPKIFKMTLAADAFGPNEQEEFSAIVGQETTSFRINKGSNTASVIFSNNNADDNTLTLKVPKPTSQQQLGVGEDVHQLGLFLKNLRIEELSPSRFINFSTPSREVSVEGVSELESWGRWSLGKEVKINFDKALPKAFKMSLKGYSLGPNNDADFLVTIGKETKSFKLSYIPKMVSMDFHNIKDQDKTITITVPHPVTPKDLGMSEDIRQLGLAMMNMEIEEIYTEENVEVSNPPQGVIFEGVSELENWGRWSLGKEMKINLPKALPKEFTLSLKGYSLGPNNNADFLVTVGNETKSFRVDHNPNTMSLDFVNNTDQAKTITITVPHPVTPKALGMGEDIRELGLALYNFQIQDKTSDMRVEKQDGKLKVLTGISQTGTHLESSKFPVKSGQTIEIPYDITVGKGGSISLALSNTSGHGFLDLPLFLGEGHHSGKLSQRVPAGETQASLVIRNGRIDAEQSAFTVNKLNLQIVKSKKEIEEEKKATHIQKITDSHTKEWKGKYEEIMKTKVLLLKGVIDPVAKQIPVGANVTLQDMEARIGAIISALDVKILDLKGLIASNKKLLDTTAQDMNAYLAQTQPPKKGTSAKREYDDKIGEYDSIMAGLKALMSKASSDLKVFEDFKRSHFKGEYRLNEVIKTFEAREKESERAARAAKLAQTSSPSGKDLASAMGAQAARSSPAPARTLPTAPDKSSGSSDEDWEAVEKEQAEKARKETADKIAAQLKEAEEEARKEKERLDKIEALQKEKEAQELEAKQKREAELASLSEKERKEKERQDRIERQRREQEIIRQGEEGQKSMFAAIAKKRIESDDEDDGDDEEDF